MKALILFLIINLFTFSNNQSLIHDCEKHNYFSNQQIPYSSFDENYFNETNTTSSSFFTMSHFFENSFNYIPNNYYSCGFVSLIQVLSYYDTFYNDNVISDAYEDFKTNNDSIEDLSFASPGVNIENYTYTDLNSYKNYCLTSMNYNFQSFLTIRNNEMNGTLMSTNDFSRSIHLNDYEALLNYSTVMPQNIKFNFYKKNWFDEIDYVPKQDELKTDIKNYINAGYPVIVHIKDAESEPGDPRFHSLVAYKIVNNQIRANFGYRESEILCDYPLLGFNYNYITSYIVLVPTFDHLHSNNYVIGNFNYCGCGYSYNFLSSSSPDWNNVPATFTWHKNPYDSTESFYLFFKLSMSGPTIYTYSTNFNCVTFSLNAWIIIRNYTSTYLYVFLERSSEIFGVSSSYIIINDPYKDMPYYQYNAQNLYNETILDESTQYSVNFLDHNILIEENDCYKQNSNIIITSDNISNINSYIIFNTSFIYRVDITLSFCSLEDVLGAIIGKTISLHYKKEGENTRIMFGDLADFISLTPIDLKIILPEKVSALKISLNNTIESSIFKAKIGGIKLYVSE